MNIAKITVSAILFVTIICGVVLLVYVVRRRRLLSTRYFFPLIISAIVYSFGYLCAVNSDTVEQAEFWSYIQYLAIPVQPYIWLMMTLEYVEADKKLQRLASIVGLYHPIIYALIFYTNPLHHQYISTAKFVSNGYFMVRVTEKEILFWVMVLSGTMICTACVIAYIYAFLASAKEHRIGIVTMALTLLPPWLAVYFTASPINTLRLDYLPVAAVFSALLYVMGVFRFRMFQFIPIAYEKVFRKSAEGILLADMTGHIIDANNAIAEMYPELSRLSGSLILSPFLESHPELKELSTNSAGILYEWDDSGTVKHYRAQLTSIDAENGKRMGQILSINDVTLLVEYQRRLETAAMAARAEAETSELSFLQAQIKPHFLNNTLSVIASMITRSPDEAKALIAELGEHLSNCYYFDSASPMVMLEKELESVGTYVAIEKARFRERLNYHLLCDDIPQISLPRLVLQPLVENAIRHGILKKAGVGNVWLTIREEEKGVRFEVKDDGVGMKAETMEKLLYDGDSTHSIGLSNIHKRLQKHYGTELQIVSRLGTGTQVSFHIPRNITPERRNKT
ncbi:MAG: signal transduction histidine kinase, LytS [Eubacterium sp.]|nr:signal transduction histidine kinase, LytS [Eubacterium sp.]